MAASPGWYPDPRDAGFEWYWNGSTYTDKRSTAPNPSKVWPANWYAVVGDPTIQREWDGQRWTGATRPTKRVLGIVSGGNPKKADAAATEFKGQVERLHVAQTAGQRGEARLAWIAAHAAIAAAYGPDSDAMWSSALSSIGFDLALVNSSFIGSLSTRGGANLDAYEDFVIFGDQALDNTRNSSMTVFESGQKQVTTSTVLNKKGKSKAVHTVHDLRVAAVQVSGPYGTIRADILPDHAPQAHQVAAQFNARMASLAPSTITAADLSTLVEAIRASNGQPAAEKLKQLDRLRYDRLLSDEDWKAAKARILSNV